MENQIINDVLRMTDVKQFNIAIAYYNIQGLYEKKRNHFLNTYFGGDLLKYSVTMRRIFDRFQTSAQEQKAKQLRDEMFFLMKEKYNQNEKYIELASKYNHLAVEQSELNKGILELTTLFKKSRNAN